MGAGVTATLRLWQPAPERLPALRTTSAVPQSPEINRAYPAVEARILSAFKLWAAVRNFFAYRDLMDGDWDQFFAEFLPRFIAAQDAQEYNLAVAAALTRIDDTNAKIRSVILDQYFGVAPVSLRIRLVEKKPVVTAVLDEEASKAGVEIGDIVTAVDGEEIVSRIQRQIQFIPASTNQSLSVEVCKRLLNGPEDSTADLSFKNRDGETRTVKLHRSTRFLALHPPERDAEPVRFLSKAIGYVDLAGVNNAQLNDALAKFAQLPAIVFDLRGDLNIEPVALASRLTAKADIAGAIVTGPVSLIPDLPSAKALTQTASFFRVETFPPDPARLYPGKTIAVIDERTIGAAEYLGLLMEAANNTLFVGSLSAGATGEVTDFSLPGNITVSFSTTDVRHGNGGKLQRVGIQVNELAPATVHAIRAKKDDALEKAIEAVSR